MADKRLLNTTLVSLTSSRLRTSLLFLFSGWLAVLCAFAPPARAQVLPADTAAQKGETPTWPEDSLGRRSPRGTVEGFIEAVADEDYAKAARYLQPDTSLQDPQAGILKAQALQNLLDKSGNIIPFSWLSKEPEGHLDDQLGPNLDRVGQASLDDESFDLYVEKTTDAAGGPLWLFSSQTVQRVPLPAVDSTTAAPAPASVWPNFLEEKKWGGVAIKQWVTMLLLLVLAYLLAWALTALISFLIRYFWHKSREEPTMGIIKAFALPIRIYLTVWILVATSREAGISIIVRQAFSEMTIIAGLAAVLLLLWRLIDVITRFSSKRLTRHGNMAGISVVLFLRRAAKIALVVLGTIAVLGTFGFDVTTGIAALGIGGIALALGAQKTVENFVGSVTLIADQPIRVGDACKVGNTVGTVEQIGMRSTRLRTADRTIVTIPNGEFSSLQIENFAHRDRFRFNPILRLHYETTPDQVRALLVALRNLLTATPEVDPDPARVRFIEIGADSLNVEVFAYINTNDFNKFLEIQEELILQMMAAVAVHGRGFALPSQSLYIARDTAGLPADEARQAGPQP
jgi:MscS family membrane protein